MQGGECKVESASVKRFDCAWVTRFGWDILDWDLRNYREFGKYREEPFCKMCMPIEIECPQAVVWGII